jgi:uncharacterized protein (TIGR00297 family)
VRLDDNIAVPAVAGAVLWGLSLVTADAWAAQWPSVSSALVPAVILNGVVSATAYRIRGVTGAGAVAGALVGSVIYAATGLAGWVLLAATFAAALVSSRLGWKRKVLLGIAEERGGARGAGNALANCSVAAFAAVLSATTPHASGALLALVAALTAGASDTVASEIGKAWGRRTYLVAGLRRVRPGTSGAISLEGTAAGLVAALALAALGVALGLIPFAFLWIAVIGATVGSLVESALGATLEAPGILNNDLLNFINTAVAAVVAVALAGMRA